MVSKKVREQRKEVFRQICSEMSSDAGYPLLQCLAKSVFSQQHQMLEKHIHSKFEAAGLLTQEDPCGNFFSFLGDNKSQVGQLVEEALDNHEKLRKKMDTTHHQLTQDLRLRCQVDAERECWFNKIPVYKVYKTDYPPKSTRIYEYAEIADMWRNHFAKKKRPDHRIKRKNLHHVDLSKLQVDLPPHEMGVFFDAATGELLMVVIRNFAGTSNAGAEVIRSVDEVVQQGVRKKRSVRLEDTGKICLAGYSMGPRNTPTFDWAKNLQSKKHSQEEIDQLNYDISSIFALFWNMAYRRLPDFIIQTFTSFFQDIGVCRMDANTKQEDSHGSYTINYQGMPITFNDVELAPPCGMLGINYSRHIHTEASPHPFAMAWTTGRTGGLEYGGHFYLASHSIRVQSAADTFVLWRPKLSHGTSLQRFRPEEVNPYFSQTGLAIVTPIKIKNLWEKYQKGRYTSAEMVLHSDKDSSSSDSEDDMSTSSENDM